MNLAICLVLTEHVEKTETPEEQPFRLVTSNNLDTFSACREVETG
jgi:hypothetical protein